MAKFKKGDRIRIISTGETGTVDQNDSELPWLTLDDGSRIWCREERLEKFDVPAVITFDDAVKRFMPHLPQNTFHTDITGDLRAYRSDDTYLSLKVAGVEIDYHATRKDKYENSPAAQAHLKQAFELLNEYEESIKPVELTMDEIANKFDIPVEKLMIKKEK